MKFHAAPAILLVFAAACVRLAPVVAPGGVETGVASWYGPGFHGRPTSSREVFDMYDMTAAHPSLPLGTRVMVTNLANGRSAEVRINDRGPFAKGRIIDLSYAAARILGLIGPGTARVSVEILRLPSEPAPGGPRFFVQVGSFASRANAEALKDRLAAEAPGFFVTPFASESRTYYRVRVAARNRAEAERIADRLAAAGQAILIVED
jgi:rare lipoprotein A